MRLIRQRQQQRQHHQTQTKVVTHWGSGADVMDSSSVVFLLCAIGGVPK